MSDIDPAASFSDDELHALVDMAFDVDDGEVPSFALDAESFAFALSLRGGATIIDLVSDSALTNELSGVRAGGGERVIRWQSELVDVELDLLADGAAGQIVTRDDRTAVTRVAVESGLADDYHIVDLEVDAFGFFHIASASSPLRLRVELGEGGEAGRFVTEWVWR